MTAQEIRQAYLKFFADRGHTVIPRANLVPQEDATTLFTGSGMQPLLPYLLGEPHSAGKQVVDSQPAFRAEDIDEVGDNRHTTLFEMLGNWSFGTYSKDKQIPWMFEFLTKVVGLNPSKLYVTCFIGAPESDIPKDVEAAEIWGRLFTSKGIPAGIVDIGSEENGYQRGIKEDERIFYYDGSKNWWNRGKTGPATTPVGDPCGPDSEMFFDFGTPHNPDFGEHCHPNCDCGRFMEIGNNVFMSYRKEAEGVFVPLASPNIDHGSGLERIAAASLHDPDIFKISLIWPIVQKLEELSGYKYADQTAAMRIIADHLRAATFLAVDGVVPSNTAQGYVARRFIRRAIRQALVLDLREDFMDQIVPVIVDIYRDDYSEMAERANDVMDVLMREETQFRKTLERGLKEFERRMAKNLPSPIVNQHSLSESKGPARHGDPGGRAHSTPHSLRSGNVEDLKENVDREASESLTGQVLFELFDTYGFPVELSLEEANAKGIPVADDWKTDFDQLMAEQKDRSRTATQGQFKGGLADHSEMSTKYHTATHLMYKALRLTLGDHVIQRGSNITPERLRFDFSHSDKLTPEQIKEVERLVNENIQKDWPMSWREENTKEALSRGVLGAFGSKYGDTVKVYTAGDPNGEWYSQEICGGPHVEHTGVLGHFRITKEESSSAGVRRIKAVLE